MKNRLIAQSLFLILMLLASALNFGGFLLLSVVLSSVLIVFYSGKYGVGFTLTGLIPLFVMGYATGGIITAAFLCFHSLSAYCVGYFIHSKGKFSSMLICATLIEAAILTAFTLYFCQTQQLKPVDFLFGASFDQFAKALANTEHIEQTMLSNFRSTAQYMLQLLQTMLPVLYLSLSTAYVYIIFGITRFFLSKTGYKIDNMPYFHELWLPGSISGIFILLFISSMFVNSPILMNMVSFMFMIYVVCGLSFAYYLLQSKRIPKSICALITIALLLFSSLVGGIFTSILCCIGMSNGTRSARK